MSQRSLEIAERQARKEDCAQTGDRDKKDLAVAKVQYATVQTVVNSKEQVHEDRSEVKRQLEYDLVLLMSLDWPLFSKNNLLGLAKELAQRLANRLGYGGKDSEQK